MPSRATEMNPIATTPHSPPVAIARVMPCSSSPRIVARSTQHPEHHGRDHGDREDRERSAEDLLGLEAQRVGAERQDEADPSASAIARPIPSHRRGSTSRRSERVEERDQDPDDECRLEAFAQADDERGEHGKTAPFR